MAGDRVTDAYAWRGAFDAYVGYGSPDAAWVRELACRLFAAGIDVFTEQWRPFGGDMLPRRLAEGLAAARCALLVFSPATLARPRVMRQYAAVTTRPVPDRPAIVCIRYGDVRLPAFTAGHRCVDVGGNRRPIADSVIRELVVAIEPLVARGTVTGGGLPVTAATHGYLRVDAGRVLCDVADTRYSAQVRVDGHRLRDLLWSLHRHDPEALRTIGTSLGATFTPDPVGRALEDAIDTAADRGAVLRLAIDAQDELGDLPWETLVLPGHRDAMAMHPAVEVYRTYGSRPPVEATLLDATPASATLTKGTTLAKGTMAGATVPGPLRILVAVASSGTRTGPDYERELAAVMDAVEPVSRYRGAHVRVLNHGSLAAIQEALHRERYHVLHLSCSGKTALGRTATLVLEDAAGHAHEVTAAELVDACGPGRRMPLVVLSTGRSEPGTDPLSGLARALVEAGTPQVLAMTAPVSGHYVTALCGGLYRELAMAVRPDVLTALHGVRGWVERQRLAEEAATGRPTQAEWAAPALFVRGQPEPARPPSPPPHPSPPSAPGPQRTRTRTRPSGRRLVRPAAALPAGRCPDHDLVGRRSDLHRLLDALRQPNCSGVLLHGIDGAGKSALAAELVRLLRLLGGQAGTLAVVVGAVTVDTILDTIGQALLDQPTAPIPATTVAAVLRDPTVPWTDRFDALARLMAGAPLLLLIDNLESTLVPDHDSWTVADGSLAAFLARWATESGLGRVVLTSRHLFDLPAGARSLYTHRVGPLSWLEARRLLWRLPALNLLPRTEQHRSYIDTGGHPGTLSYLDALLRRGRTTFADLRERLERQLRERRIDRPDLWMTQASRRTPDATLAEAITQAVRDSLLRDLVATLDRPVRALLTAAAGHRRPVGTAALAWQLGQPVSGTFLTHAVGVLGRAGLLASSVPDAILVHRFVAQALARSFPTESQTAHAQAAQYWQWRFDTTAADAKFLVEARFHHHAAGQLDPAIALTHRLADHWHKLGARDREEQLYAETLTWLPDGSPGRAHLLLRLGGTVV